MGKRRRRARQRTMWVASADLPLSAGHPFYERLNRVLDAAGHCQVADERAFFSLGAERPSLGQQAHVTSSH